MYSQGMFGMKYSIELSRLGGFEVIYPRSPAFVSANRPSGPKSLLWRSHAGDTAWRMSSLEVTSQCSNSIHRGSDKERHTIVNNVQKEVMAGVLQLEIAREIDGKLYRTLGSRWP